MRDTSSGPGSTPGPVPVLLPLSDIDDLALIRDRSFLDADGLDELKASLHDNGLRLPIEVVPATGDHPYALLSGLRRITAWRELADEGGPDAIPAFIRPEMEPADALAAVIEENEIRETISPWEKGRVIWLALDEGFFDNAKTATRALFPTASTTKASRIRSIAEAVEEFYGVFVAPERWSERQCLRIAAAARDGFAPMIRSALGETDAIGAADDDWRRILPYLEEAERLSDDQRPIGKRPIRLARPRPGLSVKREKISGGWAIRLTGPDATDMLTDSVFEEIERQFGRE